MLHERTKINLIHHLVSVHSTNVGYLEICTPTTGGHYGEIDRKLLRVSHRLMTMCPEDYDDGLPIEFRSTDADINQCVEPLINAGFQYEIIFVDPWHEYETSLAALNAAKKMLSKNGVILVHDCFPSGAYDASPNYHPGTWCGVTFKAYIDFLIANPTNAYLTIDIDHGCGLIRQSSFVEHLGRKAEAFGFRRRWERVSRKVMLNEWRALGEDYERAFFLLRDNPSLLLNLCSFEAFLAGEARWVSA